LDSGEDPAIVALHLLLLLLDTAPSKQRYSGNSMKLANSTICTSALSNRKDMLLPAPRQVSDDLLADLMLQELGLILPL
jgi:hypothetical protein